MATILPPTACEGSMEKWSAFGRLSAEKKAGF